MDEEEFVETVPRDAPLDDADAARKVTAGTLGTLGERELDAAREQLPDPFGGVFEPPESAS